MISHRGISVITPLPFGGGEGGGAIIFLNLVCSVHLCFSVRNRTHPLYELTHKQLAGEFYLSQSAQSSLSLLAHSFEPTERLRHTEVTEASPPTPLRMERGVVCEVTPFGLLIGGEYIRIIRRTYRGISVITPLSIRRGAGGEASVAVRFCEIG